MTFRITTVLVLLMPIPAIAQTNDFNQDGTVDLKDVNAARTDEELERLLSSLDHPRGDQDGVDGVMFPDFLILSFNFGSAGNYTSGDLNLDGLVGFEDFAIHSTNFGNRSYRPPPVTTECAALMTTLDPETGNIMVSGEGAINGVEIQSASGALLPGAARDGGPFEYVLANSNRQVAYVNLIGGLSLKSGLVLPVQLRHGTDIEEIEVSWSQPGTYTTFPIDLPGDFNGDCLLTDVDIDLLSEQTRAETHSPKFDLNDDRLVNQDDRVVWVEELVSTQFGDAGLDGTVGFDDFLALSLNFSKEGGWADGDFDGSGVIGFEDFLLVSKNFGEAGSQALPVPEPSARVVAIWLVIVACCFRIRRGTTFSR